MKELDLQRISQLPLKLTPSASTDNKPEKTKGPSFSQILKESIEEVNRLQQEADKAIQNLARGEHKSIHETMIALEKADISFQMIMQIRNKLIEAYQEIMRMQI